MGVGVWLWSMINVTIVPDWDSWSFSQRTHGRRTSVLGYIASRSRDFGEDTAVRLHLASAPSSIRIISPAGPEPHHSAPEQIILPVNTVIGRLGIPRLGIETMVREGDGEGTLFSSLGHIPGTAFPGEERGNVGVAGHRDTFFRRLEGIRKDDLLRFETTNGTYTYKVTSLQIVKPKDIEVLRAGDSPEMTLVTCYPFAYIGNAPDRFIVKAREVPLSVVAGRVQQTPMIPDNKPAAASKPSHTEVASAAANLPAIERPRWSHSERDDEEQTGKRRAVTVSFIKGHTQMLAPGVLAGVTEIDPDRKLVSAWVSVSSNRRTIWLSNRKPGEPIVFYNEWNGDRYQLTITKILDGIVAAHLLLPASEGAEAHTKTVANRRGF